MSYKQLKHQIMGIYEYLIGQIKEDNLRLLDEDNRMSVYYLTKLLAWQENDDWVPWEEFYENYLYCNRCKEWSDDQCICYAR